MWKMKDKVPRERERPAPFSAQELTQESAKQPDGRIAGGMVPAYSGSAEEREIIVSGLRRFSPWLVALVAAAPLAPAGAQNLDAGKSASQLFSEVCANCHRSPRELRSGASASFLREHYTTGSEMASTMAAYLAGAGSGDSRGPGGPQPKRPPNPTGNPAAGATPPATTTSREAPAPDTVRDPRRAQQAPDPKTSAGPPGSPKGRPARAEGPTEVKPLASAPPAPGPAPARPALEEFEE
jgi:hypothetical protein